MPELSTKLQILSALSRTSNDHFSVAELMAWTGLSKDQIEPQIARLKEQKILEDAPVHRTVSERLSRGRTHDSFARKHCVRAGRIRASRRAQLLPVRIIGQGFAVP